MEATFGPTESFASLNMAMDFPEVPFVFPHLSGEGC